MSFNPPRRVSNTNASSSTLAPDDKRDEDGGGGMEVFGGDTIDVLRGVDSSSDSELKMIEEERNRIGYAQDFFFEIRFSDSQTCAAAAPRKLCIWY